MITKEEIASIALKKGLDSSQVEKDYILGWILAALAEDKILRSKWVFKGGTCIRKCYSEDYRYSEDLDFTIIKTKSIEFEELQNNINSLCQYITKLTGIEFDSKRSIFEQIQNPKHQLMILSSPHYVVQF